MSTSLEVIEAAWEREADRREAELESGAVTAVSGSEAIARLRAKLMLLRGKEDVNVDCRKNL